jgi:hypothetical protein
MKAGMTASVSICLICAVVLGKLVSSAEGTDPGQRPADGGRVLVPGAARAVPSNPGPVADQRSLGGFAAAWSGSSSATKEALAEQARADASAAHEREVALVSTRMLQIQARQDPGRAEFYLQQINDKGTAPRNAVPSAQYRQAAERQRQVNDYMSAKLDQLHAAQRR